MLRLCDLSDTFAGQHDSKVAVGGGGHVRRRYADVAQTLRATSLQSFHTAHADVTAIHLPEVAGGGLRCRL